MLKINEELTVTLKFKAKVVKINNFENVRDSIVIFYWWETKINDLKNIHNPIKTFYRYVIILIINASG